MDLKGTETEKNLLISFAGESQARNRYTYYAKEAKKEGYVQVEKVFLETADQEKEHAKRFFKFLKAGGATPALEVAYEFPTGPLGATEENLRAAAAGENHEYSHMYPGFAEVADKEGFPDIAHTWRMISKAESWHEERFLKLADNIANGTVFKRNEKIKWECQNCGYIHEGTTAPEKCPACDHSKAYFKMHFGNF
ncbi:MAG: Rubrerythrin [Candidatus Thorarchaeota archaeon]|nr:MAG: Rubrerythrin [Candidatus Thorarchaeota archaeon]